MSIAKISSQAANAYFSFLDKLETVVFWMSTADYKKQLYLNKAYESVWGRPTEELQSHPEIWLDTINEEDREIIMPELINRSSNKGNGACAFRIHQPNGDIRWIKNVGRTFVDDNNNPVFIAGVDECLSPEQWDVWRKNCNIDAESNKEQMIDNFFNIIKSEYKLLEIITPTTVAQETHLPTIEINGQFITLTKREHECLSLLLKGMSAKQTAYSLHLSVRTVESYLDNLRKKANCRTKIALIGCVRLLSQHHAVSQ